MRGKGWPRLPLAVWLMLLVGAAAACSGSAAPSQPAPAQARVPATVAPAPALQPVKVSYVNALDQAPLYVAVDRGYFQANGLDVQTEPVQSAADAIAFVANGQLDAAFGAIAVPLFNAVHQGLDVRIVAPVAYADRTAVVVRKDLWDSGAVRSVADLRGRRIFNVAPGSGAVYSRIKWQ